MRKWKNFESRQIQIFRYLGARSKARFDQRFVMNRFCFNIAVLIVGQTEAFYLGTNFTTINSLYVRDQVTINDTSECKF